MMEGYLWRDDQEWMRMAQLAAWTVQPHVKRQVTADQLYRPQSEREEKKKTTYEESKAFFEEMTGTGEGVDEWRQ